MLRPRGGWVIGAAVVLCLMAGWPARAAGPDGATQAMRPLPVQTENAGQGATPFDLLTRSPAGAPERASVPLYRRWVFWAVAGALVMGAAGLTYAVTRPAPTPYGGNIQPGVIVLP